MKVLSTAAVAHLAGEVTTLAMCWRIARQDGVVMGFTDYHEDLVIGEEEGGLPRGMRYGPSDRADGDR